MDISTRFDAHLGVLGRPVELATGGLALDLYVDGISRKSLARQDWFATLISSVRSVTRH